MIVFVENFSWKSFIIVLLSLIFGNWFVNFVNDGSLIIFYFIVVNKNIVWFEVDFGEFYSINNFKLYYRKKLFVVKKFI